MSRLIYQSCLVGQLHITLVLWMLQRTGTGVLPADALACLTVHYPCGWCGCVQKAAPIMRSIVACPDLQTHMASFMCRYAIKKKDELERVAKANR